MVDVTGWAGGAHIGGSLSMADVLTALYYHYLTVRPEEPDWPERDRFVLSKGHGGLGLSCVLADKGYFDGELLKEFNHFKSPFGMHLDGNKVRGRGRQHRLARPRPLHGAWAWRWAPGSRSRPGAPTACSATASATRAPCGRPPWPPTTTRPTTSPRSSTATA